MPFTTWNTKKKRSCAGISAWDDGLKHKQKPGRVTPEKPPQPEVE
jgi:hypothetical protein